MVIERSRQHLGSVDETYFEHLRFAGSVGLLLVVSGFACLVHGLVPAWFTDRGSRTVRRLEARFRSRTEVADPVIGPDFVGLLVCGLMALAAAAIPWVLGLPLALAAPLSLLSLGLLTAAIVAGADEAPSETMSADSSGAGSVPGT